MPPRRASSPAITASRSRSATCRCRRRRSAATGRSSAASSASTRTRRRRVSDVAVSSAAWPRRRPSRGGGGDGDGERPRAAQRGSLADVLRRPEIDGDHRRPVPEREAHRDGERRCAPRERVAIDTGSEPDGPERLRQRHGTAETTCERGPESVSHGGASRQHHAARWDGRLDRREVDQAVHLARERRRVDPAGIHRNVTDEHGTVGGGEDDVGAPRSDVDEERRRTVSPVAVQPIEREDVDVEPARLEPRQADGRGDAAHEVAAGGDDEHAQRGVRSGRVDDLVVEHGMRRARRERASTPRARPAASRLAPGGACDRDPPHHDGCARKCGEGTARAPARVALDRAQDVAAISDGSRTTWPCTDTRGHLAHRRRLDAESRRVATRDDELDAVRADVDGEHPTRAADRGPPSHGGQPSKSHTRARARALASSAARVETRAQPRVALVLAPLTGGASPPKHPRIAWTTWSRSLRFLPFRSTTSSPIACLPRSVSARSRACACASRSGGRRASVWSRASPRARPPESCAR